MNKIIEKKQVRIERIVLLPISLTISQMQDFLRLYANIVEKCFSSCCNDFTSKALSSKEVLLLFPLILISLNSFPVVIFAGDMCVELYREILKTL